MPNPANLYLLPVPVSEDNSLRPIPQYNLEVVKQLRYFIAEDAKTARRFLKLFGYGDISRAEILALNEHTEETEMPALIKPLLEGENMALMSDAGCPGIADPGAPVINLCHLRNIRVCPLTGPSAIVLSVMASGFNGQNFAFVGYLPVDKHQRTHKLRELEQLSARTGQAQFFIETPYRNGQMFETMLSTLQPTTRVFIGRNIGAGDELIRSLPVKEWTQIPRPPLHKVPVVFGIFR